MDNFNAQLVKFVRQLSDEALLELVREKVGRAPGKQAKAAKRVRSPRVDRTALLAAVEAAVKASKGLSASEVAEACRVPQPTAASALRDLRAQKRVAMSGNRRFARYAGDAAAAKKATVEAHRAAKK